MVFSKIFRYFLVFSGVVVLVRRLVCLCLIVVFDLSPSYCSAWFIVGLSRRGAFFVLLRRFIFMRVIQTRRYYIMVVSMLKNGRCIYSSCYIIKFIGFIVRPEKFQFLE